ncbi:PH domain-containing protein [Georgenia wutianyii]|uniref:PH domain-containing protein n=1 Tax=Georgenia wutianyii TaxID=2585135 RepID=A0ABX5VJ65_9MICO|nr:PH domain-containing protein [Georgenia wutianyii]QDB78369.1 PH domain-containing protein [Georgenia wutianyii]
MQPAVVFRAPTSRVYAVVTWVIAVVVLLALALEGGSSALLAYGALPAVLAAMGWAAFWRPLVRVERGGVRVVNVLSTTWLPWSAVTGTRTRWGLELLVDGGKVGAWGLPARSALGRWLGRRREEPALPRLDRLTADVAGGGDPAVVARLIDQHRTGRPGAAGLPRPQRRLDAAPAALLLATTGLAIVTVLL